VMASILAVYYEASKLSKWHADERVGIASQ
jgi:hypothetical protein